MTNIDYKAARYYRFKENKEAKEWTHGIIMQFVTLFAFWMD